jgi:molybdopterin-guanine dinucleotide biosynthesis protein A
MAQRVGVVLAGGSGERLGAAKGALEVGGRPLAERAAAVLWPQCASVLISLGVDGENPAPDYPAVRDPRPAGRGPLAGLLAAFRATRHSDLLVLACDYPRVGRLLLRRLVAFDADAYDLVMPADARGRDHPLVALWSRSAEPVVAAAVERGSLKVRALLSELRVKRLVAADLPDLDLERALLNLNWPADLEVLAREGGAAD